MSYRNDVAEAKRLRKRSEEDQWRLAELTWRNVTPQGEASRRGWAADVDLGQSHVANLAHVWGQYGDDANRPRFWDAIAKVRTGDEDATSGAQRSERAIRAASPATIAKVVAASPDFQRAIARNPDAREPIEEAAIEVRGREYADPEADRRKAREVASNVSKALGGNTAVSHLRAAASEVAQAIDWLESEGVTDHDGEAKALASIKRWLRVYEGGAEWTADDDETAAEMGVRL